MSAPEPSGTLDWDRSESEEEHPPALTAIADSFAHRAYTSGLTLAEAAELAGCDRVATVRLMQCSAKIAAAELAAFARWVGCERALTAALGEIDRRRNA